MTICGYLSQNDVTYVVSSTTFSQESYLSVAPIGFYCMPSEGIELSPQGKILTNEEVLRLARLFVQSGVTKIRLTGGEPTVRKGIMEIICMCNEMFINVQI